MRTKSHVSRAFSLLELLTVMGIMALMAAVALPAAFNMAQAAGVTNAGQMIQSQLALNRQTAIARNCTVEIRFYEVPVEGKPSERQFNCFQTWIYDSDGTNPRSLGPLSRLPAGVVLDANGVSGTGTGSKSSSTIIDEAPARGTEDLPSANGNVAYRGFSYRGNGSANLSLSGPSAGQTWYLTARQARDNPGAGALPRNYFCLQVDPLTGQTRVFRP